MTRVGFAGLGRMGWAMASHLASSDLTLTVYNRTTERATEFASQHGAQAVDTAAELAAASDIVVMMLSDGTAAKELLRGDNGLARGLEPDVMIVNMATTGIDDTLGLARMVEDAGCRYADAPVSGSVATAEAAGLTIMFGGSNESLERARPVLELLSQRIFHMGEVGTGTAMKLAVNSMLFGINQALAESLVLTERAGIDRSLAYDVFSSSAVAAPVVQYRREIFEFPGERPVTFTAQLALKDLALVLALAEAVGAEMPQAKLNAEFMQRIADEGWAQNDMGDVARVLRGESAPD